MGRGLELGISMSSMDNDRDLSAISAVVGLLNELMTFEDEIESISHIDEVGEMRERLRRWKTRAVDVLNHQVSKAEGAKLNARQLGSIGTDKIRNFKREYRLYYDFLKALHHELYHHSDSILNAPESAALATSSPAHGPPGPPLCFIVHGHDHANKLQLQEILRDEWDLESIILSEEASSSRTIIQKFEEEATRATFAFVLMTPDDQIQSKDGQYAQARPNVIFELGWFCGKLGRSKVFLLVKKGTSIHSDLSGVIQIQFIENVSEAMRPIKRELVKAGIIKDSKAK